MADIDNNQDQEIESVTREYECAYLFVPTIAEEKLPETLEGLKKMLADHGAELANELQPQRIPLAYEMTVSREGKTQRYVEGYFGWVTMEASPDSIDAMKEALRRNYDLIRFMLIRAPKDQPLQTHHQDEEALVSPQTEEEREKQGDVSTTEIDESIDKLVGEEETVS